MKTVLIVEDDQFLLKIYTRQFKKESLKIETASDGEAGLKKALELKPDLIMLDLIMPKKTGFEVLTELKANDDTKDIPVIILSNLGQDSDVDKCMKAGATDFLVKANESIGDIVEKIKKLL